MEKVWCYGPTSDMCPMKDTCALRYIPPPLLFPCKDYAEENEDINYCNYYLKDE